MTVDALLERLADLVAERVAARLNGHAAPPAPTAPEPLLTARDVAARLKCSTRHVYAQAATFPFTVRLAPHVVRFSASGLDRWLANR